MGSVLYFKEVICREMTFFYISIGRPDPILVFIHLIPQKKISEYVLRTVK